jgi:hypothetical protein
VQKDALRGEVAALIAEKGLAHEVDVTILDADPQETAFEAAVIDRYRPIRSTARGKMHSLVQFEKLGWKCRPHFAACGTSVHFCMVTET